MPAWLAPTAMVVATTIATPPPVAPRATGPTIHTATSWAGNAKTAIKWLLGRHYDPTTIRPGPALRSVALTRRSAACRAIRGSGGRGPERNVSTAIGRTIPIAAAGGPIAHRAIAPRPGPPSPSIMIAPAFRWPVGTRKPVAHRATGRATPTCIHHAGAIPAMLRTTPTKGPTGPNARIATPCALGRKSGSTMMP